MATACNQMAFVRASVRRELANTCLQQVRRNAHGSIPRRSAGAIRICTETSTHLPPTTRKGTRVIGQTVIHVCGDQTLDPKHSYTANTPSRIENDRTILRHLFFLHPAKIVSQQTPLFHAPRLGGLSTVRTSPHASNAPRPERPVFPWSEKWVATAGVGVTTTSATRFPELVAVRVLPFSQTLICRSVELTADELFWFLVKARRRTTLHLVSEASSSLARNKLFHSFYCYTQREIFNPTDNPTGQNSQQQCFLRKVIVETKLVA